MAILMPGTASTHRRRNASQWMNCLIVQLQSNHPPTCSHAAQAVVAVLCELIIVNNQTVVGVHQVGRHRHLYSRRSSGRRPKYIFCKVAPIAMCCCKLDRTWSIATNTTRLLHNANHTTEAWQQRQAQHPPCVALGPPPLETASAGCRHAPQRRRAQRPRARAAGRLQAAG